MGENLTYGLKRRGLETGQRRWLHGHEAGNGGHSQAEAYGVPRQSSTLLNFPRASVPSVATVPEKPGIIGKKRLVLSLIAIWVMCGIFHCGPPTLT